MKYFAALLLTFASAATAQQIADNPEMARIYEADQSVRANIPKDATPAYFGKMIEEDKARQVRTAELLKAGALQSGKDFQRAAFIFQHGDKPGDYLLAHSLAIVAMAKGDAEASWIAAATLDRYLMAINQPQIYGTQYKFPDAKTVTQDPYDRALIGDALRGALGVPVQADQEKRRAGMEADRRKP